MTAELHRSIGRIEGRLDAMEAGIEKILDRLEVMDTHDTMIKTAISEWRGGWRMGLAIWALAAAAGAVATKVWPYIWPK